MDSATSSSRGSMNASLTFSQTPSIFHSWHTSGANDVPSTTLVLKRVSDNCRIAKKGSRFFKIIPENFAVVPGRPIDDIELECLNNLRFQHTLDPDAERTVPMYGFHHGRIIGEVTHDKTESLRMAVPLAGGGDMALESKNVTITDSWRFVKKRLKTSSALLGRIWSTRTLTFAARQLVEFIQWYIALSERFGIEHNDMHDQNVVYDKDRKRLLLIDMGRMLMNHSFDRDEADLTGLCAFTGRRMSLPKMMVRLNERLAIQPPADVAPWLGDIARLTAEVAMDSLQQSTVVFPWGATIVYGGPSTKRKVLFARDMSTVDIAKSVIGTLGHPLIVDGKTMPSLGALGAICSIGLSAVALFMAAVEESEPEEDESYIVAHTRSKKRRVIIEGSEFRTYFWHGFHRHLSDDVIADCIEIKDKALHHIGRTTAASGGSNDWSNDWSNSEDGNEDEDTSSLSDGFDDEDTFLSVLFPTSLEEAYAGKQFRTIQDIREIPTTKSYTDTLNLTEPQFYNMPAGITAGGRVRTTAIDKRTTASYAQATAILVMTLGMMTCLSMLNGG